MVGRHVVGGGTGGERACVPAVTAAAHRLQPFPQADRAGRQPAEELPDELVVALPDVPLLIGRRQHGAAFRLPAARHAVVGAEQVDEVERRLLGDGPAVLVEEHGGTQAAEVTAQPPGDVLLDPLRRRRVVPPPGPGGAPAEQRRPGCLDERGVIEEPEAPVVPLAVQRRLRPGPAAEAEPVIPGPGVRRVSVDVVQGEAEAGGEPPHPGVLAGDEFAVFLGVLSLGKEPAERADPAACPAGVVFVDLTGDAVPVPQPEGAAEPGDAGADDHHARGPPGRCPPGR